MYKIFVYEDRYEYINELISKVKDNDGSALGELYDFYKPLFICAIQRCIQKELKLSPYREDMLQESLLVLKKYEIIDLSQEETYSDIIICKGEKFDTFAPN